MQHARGKLVGKRGLRLSYGQWYPEGEPQAVTVVVHGYGEHMGRYLHVIEALNQRGHVVFALDHRGHGESEGERACVEKFDYFVEDLHLLVLEAKGAHPTLPCYMVGHSMGGLIATRYALRHEEMLDGLVLSGAALRIGDDVSPLLKRVSSLLAKVVPTLPVVGKGDNVLSRDPEVERRFGADPLCYSGGLKARMGYEMMSASEDALARMARLSLPLLIMHGTADRLTNPAGSQGLYEQASSQDKSLRLWQDNYHEIFNDLDKEQVIPFMLDWLDERLRQKAGAGQASVAG